MILLHTWNLLWTKLSTKTAVRIIFERVACYYFYDYEDDEEMFHFLVDADRSQHKRVVDINAFFGDKKGKDFSHLFFLLFFLLAF